MVSAGNPLPLTEVQRPTCPATAEQGDKHIILCGKKIKFFFLRRLSDEKLRMWCVEMSATGFDGVNLDKARELYNFIADREPRARKN
jgi:hypothetical protein